MDFAELGIIARCKVIEGEASAMSLETVAESHSVHVVRFEVEPSDYHKCGRCWRLLPEVAEDGALCARCEDVVKG